jgi:hypothetical protein
MPLLDDLATYLAAQSIGTVGVDIFTVKMPDSPSVCICLSARPGLAPDTVTTREAPGVRIQVRNVDTKAGSLAAFTKAYEIKKLLHRKTGLQLGTALTLYHRIDATGEPGWVGSDSKARPIYEVSFICHKEEE